MSYIQHTEEGGALDTARALFSFGSEGGQSVGLEPGKLVALVSDRRESSDCVCFLCNILDERS